MNRFAGLTHALLRIFAAGIYFCPGAMKLFGWFGGMPSGMQLTPLLWIGGILEVVGGALLFVGLFTRPVAFIASGEMAVAYFIGHFPRSFWPIVNHGELAVVLCFAFLFLWGNGPGPWSLDAGLARNRAGGER
jgi:putative oxidoreductase